MKQETKQRVLTALVLIPVVVWCIFYASDAWPFRILAAVIVMVGAWEWTAMMGWKKPLLRVIYAAAVLGIVAYLARYYWPRQFYLLIYGLAVLFWLTAHRWVRAYPDKTAGWTQPAMMTISGLVLLVPAWLGLTQMQMQSPWWLMYLFLLVWGADTGAYFAGRAFGKTKLAPAVSPGKTYEGLLGGIVLVLAFALAVAYVRELSGQRFLAFMGLSLLTVLAAVLGDLFESMAKRQAGIKDSGAIFPGHGGALDRIDSLTAAAPVFTLGWLLAGGF